MSEIDDLYKQYETLSLSRGREPKLLSEFCTTEWALKVAMELLDALPATES